MATLNRNPAPAAAAKPSAVAPTKKASAITPPQKTVGLERHMAVDKNVVDELLLVCGVIGTATETTAKGVETLVPVTDCLNWLQDLQRALRRDEDLYRPISLLLGKWNVVQKKLLPLVLTCRYDTPMVLTIVKILVILTKPLHENTQRAGRLVIDTKSKKVEEGVIEEQKKLRENALLQSKMLMDYKKAFVHHASHRRNRDESASDEGGLLSIFVSLLAEPLSKTGTKRTDADHLTIELVLHLFRNILSVEPVVKGSQEAASESAQLHNECISLFERELVLEILLVICQDMELRENAQYNLLMMELLHHLLKSQDPTAVARCMSVDDAPSEGGAPSKRNKENEKQKSTKSQKEKANPPAPKVHGTGGLLRAQLARDRQQFRSGAPARHGNFGGTLMLKRNDGKHQYVSASAAMDRRTQSASQAAHDLAGPKKRRNRKTEPFIGSGRSLLAHTAAGSLLNAQRGPAATRAQKTLHRFCQRFLDTCYGPVMKSLKNEFRRDSARLDGEQDQVIFFRIIWFFFQWFRVSGFGKKLQEAVKEATGDEREYGNAATALGQLIFTMDVFSFNLVLNAATTFLETKRFTRLAQTVALYSEMIHLLHSMYQSKDSTEQLMALGLMDRLFYGADPVDCLPKLLTKWVPSTTSREYVCDLVELCHITLKLLDTSKRACENIRESEEAKQSTVQVKGKNKTKLQTNDAVLQMKVAVSDFDVTSYFTRKIVSNNVVFLYTKLLEQYDFNAPHVNHRIVAFFLRLSKLKVVEGEEATQSPLLLGDGTDPLVNKLAPKTTTLEPMLYTLPMIMVLNRILNDQLIAKDQTYATLRSWAAGVVHNFANLGAANPVLFVEVLFKHQFPHRFCEDATNMYVSEELRMIAEKSLLLEAQRLEMLNYDQSDEEDNGPEDEELEFVDADLEMPEQAAGKRRKSDSDDSSENSDSDKEKATKKKRRLQPKKSSLTSDSDSSDDELEFDSTPAVTEQANIQGKVNKNKRKALDDSSDEEDDETDNPVGASQSKSLSKKSARRRPHLDDSSDEEADSNADDSGSVASKKNAAKASRKADFEDSSDEEDAVEQKPRQSKSTEVVKKMRKAILEDDTSDEDESDDKEAKTTDAESTA